MTPYYEDERHGITLYHGDCRDVLPTLDAVDHVITDPPYARDVYVRMSRVPEPGDYRVTPDGGIARMAAGAIGAVDELIDPLAIEIGRVVNRWALVFSDVESCHDWKAALERAALRYVRTGAWVKPDAMPQMSGDRPSVGFEPCTITHAKGAMRWNGGGLPALWTFNTAKGDARPDHPCPKPLPLMSRLVEQFTDAGETILDPFAGSGTTLVAAKMLGRQAIGIELEERWCEAAAKRLEATTPPLPGFVAERGVQGALEVPS